MIINKSFDKIQFDELGLASVHDGIKLSNYGELGTVFQIFAIETNPYIVLIHPYPYSKKNPYKMFNKVKQSAYIRKISKNQTFI